MTCAVDVAVEEGRIPLSRARVSEIALAVLAAEEVRHALLSIAFVTPDRIAALNREHLGHTGATDVISFGFVRATDADPVIGDIYVCADVARVAARERGIPVRDELARLIVHGTLHVLGYDHPEDTGREQSPMWTRQEQLLARVSR